MYPLQEKGVNDQTTRNNLTPTFRAEVADFVSNTLPTKNAAFARLQSRCTVSYKGTKVTESSLIAAGCGAGPAMSWVRPGFVVGGRRGCG